MRTRFLGFTLVIMVAACITGMAVFAAQGTRGQASQGVEEQPKAVRAVWALRAINTAEMSFHRANGRFGSFSELVSSGQFASLKGSWGEPFANADAMKPEEGAVPGYKLRLVVGPGGASYSVRLLDAGSCEASFFSDDVGVIFEAHPIGCEAPTKASR